MSNIKEVARKAGVSISTVSRVMNNSKRVSPELAEKVREAAFALGYSANSAAQSLRGVQSKRIAVIITSLSRTFFTSVLEGINRVADDCGYTILLAETHDSLAKEIELVNGFVAQWVDGIILASSAYGRDRATLDYISSLSRLEKKGRRVPVVTLEFAFENTDLDAVVIDSEKAAYDAVSYLIQRVNRRNIVHISLPSMHYLGQQRAAGYQRALQDAGLPARSDYIVQGDYSTFSGYRIVKLLIQTGKYFDAIFCANDQMAVGAILACNECGISVPDQVAIVGNDDIFTASLVRPSLTSIQVPRYELGMSAMLMLQGMLEDDHPHKRRIITLETKFVERGSTLKDYQEDLKHVVW